MTPEQNNEAIKIAKRWVEYADNLTVWKRPSMDLADFTTVCRTLVALSDPMVKPVCWIKHGPYELNNETKFSFNDPKDDTCWSPLYAIPPASVASNSHLQALVSLLLQTMTPIGPMRDRKDYPPELQEAIDFLHGRAKPVTPGDVAALIERGPREGEDPKEFARRAVGKMLCRKIPLSSYRNADEGVYGPEYQGQKELLEASRDVLKWLDSSEVKDTFKQMGSLSVSHPHLAVKVSRDFSKWAMSVLERFRKAVDGK